jgi:hypothetical protein
MKKALISAALAFGLAHPVFAQGLVDLVGKRDTSRSGSPGSPALRASAAGGRLDLSVSPDVHALLGEPSTRSINLGASAQWNPVCGKFDLKADFKALLGKEAREEYLEGFVTAGVSELLGSGMELLCQSMPTACSILQNNNIAANLKLLYSNDLCRSLEEAVLTGSRRGRAEAIHRCMERKLAQGKTKDEAERACLNENPEITGFDGRVVGELDLNREIRKYVSFTEGGSNLLDDLTQERRLGDGAVTQSVRPNALAERYEKLREQYLKAWSDLVQRTRAGGTSGPSTEDLENLVPAGAPPVTGVELELLARREEEEVRAFIASVSSAAALLALTRELNEVERKIEALKLSPALEGNQEHAAYLESLLGRLRAERERLLRLYVDQERFAQVLAAGHALGQAEVARSRMDSMKRALLRESSIERRIGTRAFGTPDGTPSGGQARRTSQGAPAAARSTQGAACDDCGMRYSIGGHP